ncbi:uncharacterized protein LOC143617877 [Bidens hawaiensis]|uniref:uncharacterized protein LOC143617877 n=1 Tax=Bidens hawaiensis TaxID=980011 RepID=UPI0040492054
MSKNTKRRVAKTSKKLDGDDDLKLEFDENYLTSGANASPFATWLGGELRSRISFNIENKDVRKEVWEKLWLEMKAHWKIENDKPKKIMIRRAKKNCTNFRSFLTRNFVYTGLDPFTKFPFLDKSKWQGFKEYRLSEEFKIWYKSGFVKLKEIDDTIMGVMPPSANKPALN